MKRKSIYLMSNSDKFNPANTLTHFTNNLPQIITCNGEKEVFQIALSRVIFDSNITHFRDAKDGHNVLKEPILYYYSFNRILKGLIIAVYHIDNAAISNHGIVKAINDKVTEAVNAIHDLKEEFREELLAGFRLSLDKNGMFVLSGRGIGHFSISVEMLHMLGFNDEQISTYVTLPNHKKRWRIWDNYVLMEHFGEAYQLKANDTSKLSMLLPNFVNIHCNAIEPNIISGKSASLDVIYKASFNKHSYGSIQLQPNNLHYHNLNISDLTMLHVEITDGDGNHLRLNDGQPTIMHLFLKKMLRTESISQTVYVDSNDSILPHEQCQNNFTVKLSQTISTNPSNAWVLGCKTLTMPMSINHISLKGMKNAITIKSQNAAYTYDLPGSRQFQSNGGIIQRINNVLATAYKQINGFNAVFAYEDGEAFLDYRNSTFRTQIELNEELSILMGFQTEKKVYDSVEMRQFPLRTKPDFRALIPHTIYLYVNCIQSTIVGNIATPLLTIFHLSHENMIKGGMVISLENDHVNYEEMAITDVNTITFSLRNSVGDLIDFVEMERRPCKITLTFVKVLK